MQAAPPRLLFDRLVLGLALLVLAGPVTYLEVQHPSWQSLRAAVRLGSSSSTQTAQPSQAPAKPTPVTPAPAPKAAAKTATTTSIVHLRAGKSTTSAELQDIDPGSVVTLREDSDATWQGVTFNGKDGYIYRAYLKY